MNENYSISDLRSVDERIAVLPELFRRDPIMVVGQTFYGTAKQAGVDNHAHTPDRSERSIIFVDCVMNARGASEAEKLSRHWGVAFVNCQFIGGAEEPLDICRGGDLYFYRCDFVSSKPEDRDLTLKGGARRVTFHSCQNLRQLTLGEYSKYDLKAVYPDGTTRKASVRLNARPPVRETRLIDNGPCTVTYIHAEDVQAVGDTQVTSRRYIPRFLVPAYFWARATFFKEVNPVPEEEFAIDPREVQP
jgi:hypothetical protein